MKKILDRNRTIIYMYIIISTILLCLFNNIFVFSTIEIMLVCIMFIILKFDIKHPMTLFLLIFVLYQIAFPIINYNGIVIFKNAVINTNYYLYNWLATISLIIFWGKFDNIEYNKDKIFSNINTNILMGMFIIVSIIIVISNIFILSQQFPNKYAILASNSILISIGRKLYVLLLPLMLYFLLDKKMSQKNKNIIIIIVFFLELVGTTIYGERDYLFNYIIVILMYYFTIKKISIKKLIVLGIICVIIFSLSPLLKTLKYKERPNVIITNNNIILNFFNSDFAAAGFNFNYLLDNFNEFKNGSTYIFDFFSLADEVIPIIEKYSVTKWYQSTYWNTRKTGLGFSIIGEGYVNFGLFGIIIQMMILSRMVKFVYIKSNLNTYCYTIYVMMLPLCMYACRGSLASIISPVVKYHITFAIFAYVISNKRRKIQNE